MEYRHISDTFMKLARRAEVRERSELVDSFVNLGPLLTMLSSPDHQVIYGRRGTGKTHALAYLTESEIPTHDIPIFIDMRNIGSSSGVYNDPEIPVPERATRLLRDTLTAFHDHLFQYVLDNQDTINFSTVAPHLDSLVESITDIQVVSGHFQQSEARRSEGSETSGFGLSTGPNSLGVEVSTSRNSSSSVEQAQSESGSRQQRVHFGSTSKALRDIKETLNGSYIWLILDEWSHVPTSLQPFLADLLRRTVFPITGYTVKLGAIEQRSRLRVSTDDAEYLGIELGADAQADVNLDDFMVFENDSEKAMQFFKNLLFKHYRSISDSEKNGFPENADELIRAAFTQVNVFEEFVRAAEGVPRDAINILSIAALKAYDRPISMDDIRSAARDWYQRDKLSAVSSNPEAQELLHWIIDKVIGERRARAFLLRSGVRHHLIDTLFDARVLHVLKRNISGRDEPGVRYHAFKLDYGCYVDLINTAKAPMGLFESPDDEESGFTEVPPDDYRAIRRAILNLEEFEASQEGSEG